MTSAELIATLIYSGFALVFALSLVLVQGMFLSLESRFGRWMLASVPLSLCLGIGISSLLSGRNLKYASLDIRTIGSLDGPGGASSVTRALTAIILAACFAKIVSKLMELKRIGEEPVGGRSLMAALALFFVSTHVLSALFGTHPAFIHNSYYPIAVFLAMSMARREGLETSIAALRLGLALLIVGSLVVAAVQPTLAVQTDYSGWVPGLKIRLWGLGSNANSIGPLALLLSLVLYLRPYRQRVVNTVVWLSLLVVFVLAQSKTVWAAGIVCGLLLLLYGRARDAHGKVKPGFIVALLLVSVLFMAAIAVIDVDRIVGRIAQTRVGGEISTLTGRLQIWAEAMRVWQDNVWFGYGPEAWGPWHRAETGLPFAFHAHNQLMHSLSKSGLFGAVTMSVYLVLMVMASFKAARATRGVSMALCVMMLARVVTEAPLELGALFVGETIIHLAWFMVVLIPYARPATVVAPRAGPVAEASRTPSLAV